MNDMHTVIVIIEAQAGKEEKLKEELLKISELTKLEEGCIEYRLYQDSENPRQIGIYEEWRSKSSHQEQFQKPYIIDFANKLDELLARPYEAVFGKKVN